MGAEEKVAPWEAARDGEAAGGGEDRRAPGKAIEGGGVPSGEAVRGREERVAPEGAGGVG